MFSCYSGTVGGAVWYCWGVSSWFYCCIWLVGMQGGGLCCWLGVYSVIGGWIGLLVGEQ